LGRVLVKNAENAIDTVDLILFIVDSTTPLGGGDRYIVELLAQRQTPVILGLNKADQQTEKAATLDQSYENLADIQHWPLCKFSALTGEGLPLLQSLILERLEVGPYYYPPDYITDQPERFIMAELIREQILLQTRQEVPHSVAIVIEKIEETPQRTNVFAAITVERASQKGILIGKQGTMLKEIGTAARQQIQKLIAGDVFLKLFVKVEPQWRQSNQHLLEYGYRIDD
jgi:GTP-binding protein Era